MDAVLYYGTVGVDLEKSNLLENSIDKKMKKLFILIFFFLLTSVGYAQTFKEDMKYAGRTIKKDSKKAGKAIAKTTKKITKSDGKKNKAKAKKDPARKDNE